MNFKRQQDRFDEVKWFDSIKAGYDTCGTYAFCGACQKTETNPCARAAHRQVNGYIRVATLHRRTL